MDIDAVLDNVLIAPILSASQNGQSHEQAQDIAQTIEEIGSNGSLSDVEKIKEIRKLAPIIVSMNKIERGNLLPHLMDAGWSKTDSQNFLRECNSQAKDNDKIERRRKAREKSEKRRGVLESGEKKPVVYVRDKQLSEIVDRASSIIDAYNKDNPNRPILMAKGSDLVTVIQDSEGAHMSHKVSASLLKYLLATIADWLEVYTNQDGEEAILNVSPKEDAVRAISGMGQWTGVPPLDSIVGTPIFCRKWDLQDLEGYSSPTNTYYTGGVALGDTDATDIRNVMDAKFFIEENLFADFPLNDESSLAHAWALFLLPYVRFAINGPTPLHLMTAPMQGTGKGLLGDVCLAPFLGHDPAWTSAAENADEWRKKITTALMSSSSYVGIDNVSGALDSDSLASALTQSYWEDRVLGSNKEVRIKIRKIWVANGNNVSVSKDIARRCIWIRLDSNVEKPWERTEFRHPNIRGWVNDNRDKIVTSALTLINYWIKNGRPAFSGAPKGSYEEWSGVMGGILECIGVEGFLGNETEFYEESVEDNDGWSEFVDTWYEKFGEKETLVGDLFMLASYSEDALPAQEAIKWLNLLEDHLGSGKERARKIRLGKLLKQQSGRVIGEYKIQKGARSNAGARWFISKVTK